jgi:hypothetical protein
MACRRRAPGVSAAGLVAALAVALGAGSSSAANRYLRPSLLGYGTVDPKVARVLSKTNLNGATFRVLRVPAGTIAFSGTLPASSGAWGGFGFTHRLDFTSLTESGAFRLSLPATGETSAPFAIGDVLTATPGYKPLARALLGFFAVQRCGPTSPADHGVCHLLDAHHIVGGPDAGQPVDVQGGWHDAGDYIKFATTVAYSTHLLLWAHELRPNLAGDWNGNGVADLLDEARIGARFLLRLRYQTGRFLFQVSDAADHGEGWRLPEDDALTANRPATYGPGKNHLGRYVAALARAARAYSQVAPSFADSCRVAALDAYAVLASAPDLVGNGFYDDSTYHDKVALGAAELYLTTGQAADLVAAKSHADLAGPGYWSGWGTVNGLADALLAPYHAPALANLLTDVGTFRDDANLHPFGMAGTEVWGTNLVITGMAAEGLLYERLTGLATYNGMAWAQRDFLLGANPWGVCFVGEAAPVSPRDFHHQVAVIQHAGALPGALTEGPATAADILDQGIVLENADEYAEFQAARGTYHDDRANYVTNEPTIAANASMLFMLALFASREAPTSTEDLPPGSRKGTLTAVPNPFHGSTWIVVRGADRSPAATSVQVHDVAGRLVRRLLVRGPRGVAWDGLDARGNPAPGGIYFLSAGGAIRGRVVRLQ